MNRLTVSFGDQNTEITFPKALRDDLAVLFGASAGRSGRPSHSINVAPQDDGRFSLDVDGERIHEILSRDDLLNRLQDEAVHSLIVDAAGGVVLHAAAVSRDGRAILVAGPTGSGKTSLAAWFVANGFGYMTDEIVALAGKTGSVAGFPRAMVLKDDAAAQAAELPGLRDATTIRVGDRLMLLPAAQQRAPAMPLPCGLIVFPRFEAGTSLSIGTLSPAQAGMRLMECNLNARNLPGEGFADIAALSRRVPAIVLRYGDFDQLDGVADTVADLLLDELRLPKVAQRVLGAFATAAPLAANPPPAKRYDVQPATPPRPRTRLTIGMATYDDYDGVYFSLQALRLYHPEIVADTTFLVVDNHPDGPCGAPLKQLEAQMPNYRYVPNMTRTGTAIRDAVFDEADSDFVLCLDSHVFVAPGALKRLIDYVDANPATKDLLQGPLLFDDLKSIASHFEPIWSGGMYGRWKLDPRADDADAEPFDIPMQGLGLFACRKDAWPGFNRQFRGFGAEEGYIHEKIRQAGGRTLCLPFLRWVHRFNRPHGVPYSNRWEDRIRNYTIGFREVGWPVEPMIEHFRELLGRDNVDRILADIEDELAEP